MSLPIVILGTGVAALTEAIRLRRDEPGLPLVLVDAAPDPGGEIHTLRSEGFVCELGWQALWPGEEVGWLARAVGLEASLVPSRRTLPRELARLPWLPPRADDDEAPALTFPGGLEALVQAARIELGSGCFALGRPIVAVTEDAVRLGGGVEREIRAERILRPPEASAQRPGGVYLGFWDTSTRRLDGAAGFVIPPDEHPFLRAALFCSSLWPGRAARGKSLVRLFAVPGGEPVSLATDAERILRERTRMEGPLLFRRVWPAGRNPAAS